jgi:hypothetical protein
MFTTGVSASNIIVLDVTKLALDSIRMPFARLIQQAGRCCPESMRCRFVFRVAKSSQGSI